MTQNKDKVTTDLTNGLNLDTNEVVPTGDYIFAPNVCTEHEWIVGDLIWGDDQKVKFVANETGKFKVSKNDFKIEENTSAIGKEEASIIRGQIIVHEGETLEDAHKKIKGCKHEYNNILRCKFCGTKMSEEEILEEQRILLGNPNWKRKTVELIEDNNWDEIIKDFYYFTNRYGVGQQFKDFTKWLKENYLSPEKK